MKQQVMDTFDKEPNIRRPNRKETRREDGKLRSKELEALFEEPRTLKRREKPTENEDGEKKKQRVQNEDMENKQWK